MTKFPLGQEANTRAIRTRITAALAAKGLDLDWLAGDIGVSTHRLLGDLTTGPSIGLVYDAAQSLNLPFAFLAVGEQ